MGGQVDLGCIGGLEVNRWTVGGLRWTGGGLGGLRWTEVEFMGCAGNSRMGMESIGVIWVCGELLSTRTHIRSVNPLPTHILVGESLSATTTPPRTVLTTRSTTHHNNNATINTHTTTLPQLLTCSQCLLILQPMSPSSPRLITHHQNQVPLLATSHWLISVSHPNKYTTVPSHTELCQQYPHNIHITHLNRLRSMLDPFWSLSQHHHPLQY